MLFQFVNIYVDTATLLSGVSPFLFASHISAEHGLAKNGKQPWHKEIHLNLNREYLLERWNNLALTVNLCFSVGYGSGEDHYG